MGERSTIEGTVENVVFQNEENGYTVLSLLTDQGEVVTVVGCIPFAAAGESMEKFIGNGTNYTQLWEY